MVFPSREARPRAGTSRSGVPSGGTTGYDQLGDRPYRDERPRTRPTVIDGSLRFTSDAGRASALDSFGPRGPRASVGALALLVPEENKQVRVELVLVGGRQPVRGTWVDLLLRARNEVGRLRG
jgi:hypothetical protein